MAAKSVFFASAPYTCRIISIFPSSVTLEEGDEVAAAANGMLVPWRFDANDDDDDDDDDDEFEDAFPPDSRPSVCSTLSVLGDDGADDNGATNDEVDDDNEFVDSILSLRTRVGVFPGSDPTTRMRNFHSCASTETSGT